MDRYEDLTVEEMLYLAELGYVAVINDGQVLKIMPAEWEEE